MRREFGIVVAMLLVTVGCSPERPDATNVETPVASPEPRPAESEPDETGFEWCTLNCSTRSSFDAVVAFFGKEPVETVELSENRKTARWVFGLITFSLVFDGDRLECSPGSNTPEIIFPTYVSTLAEAREMMRRAPDKSVTDTAFGTTLERWEIDGRFAILFCDAPGTSPIITGTKAACDAADLAQYDRTFDD